MSKHFYHQYISKKTGKTVRANLPSYCFGRPAVPFDPAILKGWCPKCMKAFEKQALGGIAKVLTEMSK